MNYETEQRLVGQFYKDCEKTLVGKAHDYAQDNDCFSNFKFIAEICKVPVEKTFLMFLAVKIARLSELIGKVAKNESKEDTLMDLANYACLYNVYLKEQGKE